MKPISRSLRIFLCLMAYLAVIKLALVALPGVFRSPAQAKVFEWPFLALWSVLGSVGVWLSERTNFPAAWETGSTRRRILVPALWGVALGILAVATDAATGWARFVAGKLGQPSIHIPFPASLLIYPGGAIVVEVVYRLFAIPVLLWLASPLLGAGRRQERAFWCLAALTSLLEPLGDLGLRELGLGTMASVFVQDYALNFAQAWLFRRRGFLAAIVLRVAFYLVWHVLWGLAA